MFFIVATCPFCNIRGKHRGIGINQRFTTGLDKVSIIVRCFACNKDFLATTSYPRDDEDYKQIKHYFNTPTSEVVYPDKVFNIFPKPEFYIHSSFPDDIKELIHEIYTTKSPKVAVMCARAILDYTLKNLGIRNDNKNLYDRIQDAYNQEIITKPVAEWAHIIRKFGNFAIHELKATEKEVDEVKEFIKIFLDLVYRIPYEINKFKS